jgi:heme/copper-type cytochrome/quinol oxidase subunit 2
MRRNEIIAVALAVLATVGTIAASLWYEASRDSGRQLIELLAIQPQNGNWQPNQIRLELGKPVRLKIRNIETVSHGFALPEFGIGITEIKPGEVRTVDFTPDKAGVFAFYCTVWCSNEHMAMSGQVIVSQTTARK